jgi:class 3 adenylate cyclase
MAATLNDHLDYFGSTVNLAATLPGHGRAGEMILSQVLAAEPEVLTLLQTRHWLCEPIDTIATDAASGLLHRVRNSDKAIAD